MSRSIIFSLFSLAVLVTAGCSYTYKIKSGTEAFSVMQYSVAVQMLAEEYEATDSREERAYKAQVAGRAYDKMNRAEEATLWYDRAIENGAGAPAMELKASALRRQERYEEAIETYQLLMSDYGQESDYVAAIAQCRQAIQWRDSKAESPYQIEEASFNTTGSDYAPFVAGPNQIIITSDRGGIDSDEVYHWTGRAFSDLYITDPEGFRVEPFDRAFNSKENDGTIALSQDGTMAIFTRCFSETGADAYCKLMQTTKANGRWETPRPLQFLKEDINYGHPVLARNDSILFFVSDDPAGEGGYDIYFVTLGDNGWSEPSGLGPRINTGGDEKFPSLDKDTLYFSSDYLPGMGGLDIFKTYPGRDGNWVPPMNLKPPVNSGWDDFGLVVDTFAQNRGDVLQSGYFCTSRGGNGGDNIYAFVKTTPPEPAEPEVTMTDEEKLRDELIKYQLFLALRVVEPVFEDPNDPNSKRISKRPLENARVAIGEGTMMNSFRTDSEGYLIVELKYDKIYNLRAQFRGLLTRTMVVDATEVEKDPNQPVKTLNRELILEPIFRGVEIVLENIYYDLDKWDIRPDAEPALNELSAILRDNPQLRIQLGSHTDCRADDAYNLELSQKRAQSAVDYLIAQGINASRLEAVGYGETQFAVDCPCDQCSEEEHQANRRTTFKVIQ